MQGETGNPARAPFPNIMAFETWAGGRVARHALRACCWLDPAVSDVVCGFIFWFSFQGSAKGRRKQLLVGTEFVQKWCRTSTSCKKSGETCTDCDGQVWYRFFESRDAGFTTLGAPASSESSSSGPLAKHAHEGFQRRSDYEKSQKHHEGDFICSFPGDGAGERFAAGAVSGGRRGLFQNGAP